MSGGHNGGGGQDLMALIHQAGFTGQAANTMYGIVMAESSGNARAFNGNSNTGDQSYGLAQINMIGGMGPERRRQFGLSSNEDLYDPATNLRVAYALSNGGRDFSPWSTYNSGAYQQYAGQSGAKVTSSGGGGGSASPNAGGDKPTQDQYQAVDDLGQLLSKIPELRGILNNAISGGWSIQTFTNKVEDSDWWKQHSSAARAAIIKRANDPASWNQDLHNLENTIGSLSKQLGFTGLSQSVIENIATSAIMSGNQNNNDWLTHALGRHADYSGTTSSSDLNGQMAQVYGQLQDMSKAYGIQYSVPTLSAWAKQIVVGNNSLDHYREQFKNLAAGRYPGIASQIQAGQTVQQIADPYIQSYSQLLELDPNSVSLTTPLIQQALQGSPDPQGKSAPAAGAMPLYQFEKLVRTDPKWQYTQNAKDTFSTALLKVGHDFGFGF